MNFSDNAMSAILLCSYIGIKKEDSIKPLSLGEWNLFLDRLIAQKKEPGAVLSQDLSFLGKMEYTESEIDRIEKLVSRGGSAAFELDDLMRKGIGVITQFDADYPVLLKRKLKRKMPPVLFFAGNIELAKKIGIAVVGSRNVDQEGMDFTKRLVEKAAQERLIVYSGGAKGVDSISENAAINAGSAVVSFISDSLFAKIKKGDILNHIMQGKMLLLSDVKPDAGFSAARAMNRNKYIYAASYGAFVVASDYNKGGTWAGATEAIRNNWTKVLVWAHEGYEGNLKLIEKGAISYHESDEKIYDVIIKKEQEYTQLDFSGLSETVFVSENKTEYAGKKCKDEEKQSMDLYDIIKSCVMEHLNDGMNVDEASKKFNVAKGQMATWLKRMQEEGLVVSENGRYIASKSGRRIR